MAVQSVDKMADSVPTSFAYPSVSEGCVKNYVGVVVERDTYDSVLVELHDDYGIRAASGLKPEYRRLKLAKMVGYTVLN